VRLDLALGEVTHGISEHDLLVGESEVHGDHPAATANISVARYA
jgi:hypothetical protein